GGKVGDLVAAQDRPQEHVAEPALGKVGNFDEDRIGLERLLGAQVALDRLLELLVAVAEASEESRARRTLGILEQHAETSIMQLLWRAGGERRADRESIGERRRGATLAGRLL